MKPSIRFATLSVALVSVIAGLGCAKTEDATTPAFAHTLYVAHNDGTLISYDISTGTARAGQITNANSPSDMQALADGTVMINLTDRNEILQFDGQTMIEKTRVASSAIGGTRPVHSFVTPKINGKQYWMTANDGVSTDVTTNSARFVDVVPTSSDYLKPVGEIALGLGHHKASFSSKKHRVAISNISECNNVISVYDFTDIANITTPLTISAANLGYDGSTVAKTCITTGSSGKRMSPHGSSTATAFDRVYHNLTGTGEIVSIAIDQTPPTFTLLTTSGSGGGYTRGHPDGRYVFTLQKSPREGSSGATCQIGQLVVVDGSTDTVVKQLALGYTGPSCTQTLTGTDEATAGPAHMQISHGKKTLYITLSATAPGVVRKELVLDITDPANPVQKESITVGAGTGNGDALSGDGKFLFVANSVDNTVTQIDTSTSQVVKTITVGTSPKKLATFGGTEGPSHQTGPQQE